MIFRVCVAKRELIHILKCMCLMGAVSEEELSPVTETGYVECDAMTLSCTQEDFVVVALIIEGTQALFETLEGLETVAPLCMGISPLEADHQCSICLDDAVCGEWVPQLECDHLFHDRCLLRWVTGTSAMRNSCPECRHPINNKRQILLRVMDYGHYYN